MSQACRAALIQAQRDALTAAQDSTSRSAQATLLGMLQTLRLLDQHAVLATDEPAGAAVYRVAARDQADAAPGPVTDRKWAHVL